ncbi:MAG: repressor LexA [Bdellovibrionales bacterium]|nr:repressor LexA [Bdellovibrionales bacterium]
MPTSKSNSASASPKPLTPKEKKVFDFVDQFIAQNEFAPSYQEIKDHFGFASFNSVQRYLKQLQSKNYIHVPPGNQKRAITVLQSSYSSQQPTTTQNPIYPTQNFFNKKEASPAAPPVVSESLSVPLLGRVAAGLPLEAFEHDEFVDAPPTLIRNPEKTFALRVEGQSMIEDGILDGDIIFVQEQNTASNGDTIVAMIENEATVKRFYVHKRKVINSDPQVFTHHESSSSDLEPKVELRPANSSMESMWFDPRVVSIRGIVVGLLRKM